MYKDHSDVIATVFKYFLCKIKENLRVSYCSINCYAFVNFFANLWKSGNVSNTHGNTYQTIYSSTLCASYRTSVTGELKSELMPSGTSVWL